MSKLMTSQRFTLTLAVVAVAMTSLDGLLLAQLGPIGTATGAGQAAAAVRLGLLGGLMLAGLTALAVYGLLREKPVSDLARALRAAIRPATMPETVDQLLPAAAPPVVSAVAAERQVIPFGLQRDRARRRAAAVASEVIAALPQAAPVIPTASAPRAGQILSRDYDAAVGDLRSAIRMLMANTLESAPGPQAEPRAEGIERRTGRRPLVLENVPARRDRVRMAGIPEPARMPEPAFAEIGSH